MKKHVLLASVLFLAVASAHAQFTFTTIDCPGQTETTARSINNPGEMVGRTGQNHQDHAVLIADGKCTPLAPSTVLGTNFSEAFKNNDSGDVVGFYLDSTGTSHGFLLSKKGVLTTLDFPGAASTTAWGINESGTVVGYFDVYSQGVLVEHGFTWNNGKFSQVDFPGSGDTGLDGINARGDFVGSWDTGPTATVGHGLIFSMGRFSSFDVPVSGATLTQLNDISANEQIIGIYVDAGGNEHGFRQVGAVFTSIDYPNATLTSAWGINSAGQIVGTYFDSAGRVHGYLALSTK